MIAAAAAAAAAAVEAEEGVVDDSCGDAWESEVADLFQVS